MITSEERVVMGQTSSGQPVVARARYTRMEATVTSPDDQEAGRRDVVNYSEDDDDSESTSTPRGHQPDQVLSEEQPGTTAAHSHASAPQRFLSSSMR